MEKLKQAAKAALLITTDDALVNDDIESLVNAAIADLRTAGVAYISAEAEGEQAQRRALYERAVVLFCKSLFLIDETQAKRAAQAYSSLKLCMSLDDDYTEVQNGG